MALTTKERELRDRALRNLMKTQDLQALLLIGDTNVGHHFYGDLRYYTDNRIIFYRQVVVILPETEPVLFAGSEIQRQAALRRSSVKDCRLIDNPIVDVVRLLKERGIFRGKVGVNLEMLSTAWYLYLRQELPQIEWVETHEQIMQIRFQHSKEEMEIFRKGAKLGDGGFEAVLRMIRPGVNEFEIAAEIERAARSGGAEDHFTLIGSGKFSLSEENALPLPYSPSFRQIELGDSVVMEISPRYEGYWTQLVRTLNVGKANKDLEKIHRICHEAINKGLEQFKPGKRVKDVVLAMEDGVKESGYFLKPPIGHICGVDMVEARVTGQNEMVLQAGTAVIIHPTVFSPDEKHSFFWGETYLVKEDGYERLHRSTDELLTI